jgi:hypothetical protein
LILCVHALPTEDVWEDIGQRSSDAYEEALHDKACGALIRVEFIGDESAKRFHRDVDAGV